LSQVAPWDTWEWEWDTPAPTGMSASSIADEVERSTDDFVASVATLPEGGLAAPRTFDRWSGLDVLAHCLAWAEICAKILREMAAGTLDLDDYRDLPVDADPGDDLNQRQVDELRGTPRQEMVQRLERARDAAAGALRRLEGDPPVMLVMLSFGAHLDEHAAGFREAAGA
jgi:mycothiol maleylpyruvate isomerase-like protein